MKIMWSKSTTVVLLKPEEHLVLGALVGQGLPGVEADEELAESVKVDARRIALAFEATSEALCAALDEEEAKQAPEVTP